MFQFVKIAALSFIIIIAPWDSFKPTYNSDIFQFIITSFSSVDLPFVSSSLHREKLEQASVFWKYFFLLIFFLSVDGFKILIEIYKRPVLRTYTSNPQDVTALIACYNSAKTIKFTIDDLQKILSNDRIIVVDDGSTDNTFNIAKNMGVQVYRFEMNKGKVAAINFGIYRVKTKYTLLLDDDTRVGPLSPPTSLLEEGYTGVAFNLLPCRRTRELNNGKNFVSCLQRYEYSKSMEIGKRFQDGALSVSCISGAVGLFLTSRLNSFHHLHSTVFQGEDLERTLIDLLKGGKVAFVNQNVWTFAPDNWLSLTKQRLCNWYPGFYRNIDHFFHILFDKQLPLRLKGEMFYNIFVILTDPLRIYSFFALFIYKQWAMLLFVYLFYLAIEIYPFIVVEKYLPVARYYMPALIAYPIYGIYNTLLRSLALFVWLYNRFITKRMRPKGRPGDRIA